MKKLFVALALLFAAALPAQAQCPPNPPPTTAQTKAALNSSITNCFADNTTGAITPAITRGMLTGMVNSFQQYGATNIVSATSYTVATTDFGTALFFTAPTAVAVSLPTASGSFLPFNFSACNLITNAAANIPVTITPASGTINGLSALVLPAEGDCWTFVANTSGPPAWSAISYSNIGGSVPFTPALTFGGGSTGITYVSRAGAWWRHGPLVHLGFNLLLSNAGSSTGQAVISTLPFNAIAPDTGACGFYYANMNASVTSLVGFVSGGSNNITLYQPIASITATLTNTAFTNTSQLYGSCSYLAN